MGITSTDTSVEALAAVFTVGIDPLGFTVLKALLWQRARWPDAGKWALPGGGVEIAEDVDTSMSRQLAQKVDLSGISHLEQLGVFSAPDRVPRQRVMAVGFLGLVPSGATPSLPPDTAWETVDKLPATALDHGHILDRAHERLRAKLSYTNIAFGLAPAEFTIAELTRIYRAVLGHDVDATNMQRILTRRAMLVATGGTAPTGRSGGRPAALYRFADSALRITDPFAAFGRP